LERKFIHLEETDSTNLLMVRKQSAGENIEGLVISTDYQSEGKGLETNRWHSSRAKNLLFSMCIKPGFLEPSRQFLITKVISLSMLEVLSDHLPQSTVKIKWPNDIYVNNRKIAGMLISNFISGRAFEFSVIGIGLNVNEADFPAWIPNPISMTQITGKIYDRHSLLLHITKSFEKWIELLRNADDLFIIESQYLDALLYFNEWHDFIIKDTHEKGKIIGVSEFGQLRVESKNGVISTCDLKEIVFL
jgi:BirA family transcriptional regulator, biotin operon repressor / biotin---[acetyl-CoA-carboxylase] ligase